MYNGIKSRGGIHSDGAIYCFYFIILVLFGNCILDDNNNNAKMGGGGQGVLRWVKRTLTRLF